MLAMSAIDSAFTISGNQAQETMSRATEDRQLAEQKKMVQAQNQAARNLSNVSGIDYNHADEDYIDSEIAANEQEAANQIAQRSNNSYVHS